MKISLANASAPRRLALLALGLCALLAASAVEAEEPATAPREKETVFSLIMKGRWIMIPMGICSMITLTFAIERAISWRKSRVGSVNLVDEVLRVLPASARTNPEDAAQALAICDASNSIVGRLLRTGVERLHRDEAHAQASLEDAAGRVAHLLKRKVRVFSVISALSPLLGLLGTISGMITCFEKATAADSGSRVTTLTQGIYEALVATATGLLIAIVALILYHYFLGVVDRIVDLLDEAASRFLDHYYAGEPAGQARPASAVRADAGRRDKGGRAAAAAGGRQVLEAGE